MCINFSAISPDTLLGKLARFPLRLIPPTTVIPILQGKLKGKRWIKGSSNDGCWLGSYERKKSALFGKTVKPGTVIFDIGANVGYYTLLASVLTGSHGKVFSFEPVPRNLIFLRDHLDINHITNVTVFDEAISDRSGVMSFDEGSYNSLGHFSERGGLKVKTINLDELIFKQKVPAPDYIKIDVEGAENLVLSGAKKMLRDNHPTIFLATHAADIHQECCFLLHSFGYKVQILEVKEAGKAYEVLAS